MTPQLQHVVMAARALSSRDKLELLQIISHDLQQSYAFTEETTRFWHPSSIQEMADAQAGPFEWVAARN